MAILELVCRKSHLLYFRVAESTCTCYYLYRGGKSAIIIKQVYKPLKMVYNNLIKGTKELKMKTRKYSKSQLMDAANSVKYLDEHLDKLTQEIYNKCIHAGFTEEQASKLAKIAIDNKRRTSTPNFKRGTIGDGNW